MAEGKVITALKKTIKDFSDAEIRNREKASNIHRVTITRLDTAKAMQIGMSFALIKIFPGNEAQQEFFEEYNTIAAWSGYISRYFTNWMEDSGFPGGRLVKDVKMKDFSTFKASSSGNCYVLAGSTNTRLVVEMRQPSANRTINNLCGHIKDVVWKMWLDDVQLTAKEAKPGRQTFGMKGATYAHNEGSELGIGRIHNVCKAMQDMASGGEFPYLLETANVSAQIFKRAKLGIRMTPKQEQGILTGEIREIDGTFTLNTESIGDWKPIQKRIMGKGAGSFLSWLKKNKRAEADLGVGESSDEWEASNKFTKDAGASMAAGHGKILVNSLKKKGLKGKIVASKKAPIKRNPRKIEADVSFNSRTKIDRGLARFSQVVYAIGSNQKGEKGQTSLAEMLKLKKLINKRLPAEVRRQMGRPALINQTGRFSNSTQVTKFKETAAGISGEYTYQRNPYETFENTGSRKWPNGYNPKPLIAKSIRSLALQYTEQKLTSLRRT